jgi:hypothetical protein
MTTSIQCNICFEEYDCNNDIHIPYIIPCGHSFCRGCLTSLDKCPLCCESYVLSKIRKNYQYIELLSNINIQKRNSKPKINWKLGIITVSAITLGVILYSFIGKSDGKKVIDETIKEIPAIISTDSVAEVVITMST